MKKRELTDIQREYTQVCAAAGDIQFKIDRLSDDLQSAKQALLRLNKEYTKAVEYSKQSEETPAPTTTEVVSE